MKLALCCAAAAFAPAVHAVSCSVSTAGIAFGAYDLLSSAPIASTVTVLTTCALEPADGPAQHLVAATISLSTGRSNAFAQRQMASGSERMNYNVYTSNTYATVWGDGSGGSAVRSVTFTLNPARPSRAEDLTGYGRVPALQNVAVGNYADALVVSVAF